jgi:hypothetical protein
MRRYPPGSYGTNGSDMHPGHERDAALRGGVRLSPGRAPFTAAPQPAAVLSGAGGGWRLGIDDAHAHCVVRVTVLVTGRHRALVAMVSADAGAADLRRNE